MSQPVKRQYDTSRRREQAEETRRRIIEAAHDLFLADGYGRTTIAAIAREAGVSVETVYAAFRNKPALLRQVWFVRFRGDEADQRLLHRPEIQLIFAEPDLVERLRLQAVTYTAIFRRFVPLHRALTGAAASEPEAAAMIAEFDERRLEVAGLYARAAAETGQLTIDEDECRDLFYATLDGFLWYRLVAERGWSDDRFADFLAQTWQSALVIDR